jgi:hypothetical protein
MINTPIKIYLKSEKKNINFRPNTIESKSDSIRPAAICK